MQKKNLTLGTVAFLGAFLLFGSVGAQVYVSTGMSNPTHRIQTIIFGATEGDDIDPESVVTVTATRDGKVAVDGSLATNDNAGESITVSSILGGIGNIIEGVNNVSLIGGAWNTIKSRFVSLFGGIRNSIEGRSDSSFILGGSENAIRTGVSNTGLYNIFFGGSESLVSGTGNIAINTEKTKIAGAENVVAGTSGGTITGDYLFAWGDMGTGFVGHSIMLLGGKMAISTATPQSGARVTISGDVRVGEDSFQTEDEKMYQNILPRVYSGTMRTVVKNDGGHDTACTCLYDGEKWNPTRRSAFCKAVCRDITHCYEGEGEDCFPAEYKIHLCRYNATIGGDGLPAAQRWTYTDECTLLGDFVNGDPLTVVNPSLTGHDFDGRDTDPTCQSAEKYVNGSTLSLSTDPTYLYACRSAKKYRLAYDIQGGNNIPPFNATGKVVTYGEEIGDLPSSTEVEKAGFSLSGRYTDAEEGERYLFNTRYSATTNATGYARWRENTTNDGKVIICQLQKDGSYNCSDERTGSGGTREQVRAVSPVYNIDLDGNGGLVQPANVPYTGRELTKTFSGWLFNNQGALMARTSNPAYYIYRVGKIGILTGDFHEYLPSVTLPTATRECYSFSGWYSAPNEGTRIGSGGDTYTGATGDTMLYAQRKANTYSITYHLNGGEGDTTPTEYTADGPTIVFSVPAYDGMIFEGRYDNLGFNGSPISTIAQGTCRGDLDLRAKRRDPNRPEGACTSDLNIGGIVIKDCNVGAENLWEAGSGIAKAQAVDACGTGYHLPTLAEWRSLFDVAGGRFGFSGAYNQMEGIAFGSTYFSEVMNGNETRSGLYLPKGFYRSSGATGSIEITGTNINNPRYLSAEVVDPTEMMVRCFKDCDGECLNPSCNDFCCLYPNAPACRPSSCTELADEGLPENRNRAGFAELPALSENPIGGELWIPRQEWRQSITTAIEETQQQAARNAAIACICEEGLERNDDEGSDFFCCINAKMGGNHESCNPCANEDWDEECQTCDPESGEVTDKDPVPEICTDPCRGKQGDVDTPGSEYFCCMMGNSHPSCCTQDEIRNAETNSCDPANPVPCEVSCQPVTCENIEANQLPNPLCVGEGDFSVVGDPDESGISAWGCKCPGEATIKCSIEPADGPCDPESGGEETPCDPENPNTRPDESLKYLGRLGIGWDQNMGGFYAPNVGEVPAMQSITDYLRELSMFYFNAPDENVSAENKTIRMEISNALNEIPPEKSPCSIEFWNSLASWIDQLEVPNIGSVVIVNPENPGIGDIIIFTPHEPGGEVIIQRPEGGLGYLFGNRDYIGNRKYAIASLGGEVIFYNEIGNGSCPTAFTTGSIAGDFLPGPLHALLPEPNRDCVAYGGNNCMGYYCSPELDDRIIYINGGRSPFGSNMTNPTYNPVGFGVGACGYAACDYTCKPTYHRDATATGNVFQAAKNENGDCIYNMNFCDPLPLSTSEVFRRGVTFSLGQTGDTGKMGRVAQLRSGNDENGERIPAEKNTTHIYAGDDNDYCAFDCVDSEKHWEGESCMSNVKLCDKNLIPGNPDNAVFNTGRGDPSYAAIRSGVSRTGQWVPAVPTPQYVYTNTGYNTGDAYCTFRCKNEEALTGFHRADENIDGDDYTTSGCISNFRACKEEEKPEYASRILTNPDLRYRQIYSGALGNWTPAVAYSAQYADNASANPCAFTCNEGYHRSGSLDGLVGTCVSDYESCVDDKPAQGAKRCTAGQLTTSSPKSLARSRKWVEGTRIPTDNVTYPQSDGTRYQTRYLEGCEDTTGDPHGLQCAFRCLGDQLYNEGENTCECEPGTTRNASTQRCECDCSLLLGERPLDFEGSNTSYCQLDASDYKQCSRKCPGNTRPNAEGYCPNIVSCGPLGEGEQRVPNPYTTPAMTNESPKYDMHTSLNREKIFVPDPNAPIPDYPCQFTCNTAEGWVRDDNQKKCINATTVTCPSLAQMGLYEGYKFKSDTIYSVTYNPGGNPIWDSTRDATSAITPPPSQSWNGNARFGTLHEALETAGGNLDHIDGSDLPTPEELAQATGACERECNTASGYYLFIGEGGVRTCEKSPQQVRCANLNGTGKVRKPGTITGIVYTIDSSTTPNRRTISITSPNTTPAYPPRPTILNRVLTGNNLMTQLFEYGIIASASSPGSLKEVEGTGNYVGICEGVCDEAAGYEEDENGDCVKPNVAIECVLPNGTVASTVQRIGESTFIFEKDGATYYKYTGNTNNVSSSIKVVTGSYQYGGTQNIPGTWTNPGLTRAEIQSYPYTSADNICMFECAKSNMKRNPSTKRCENICPANTKYITDVTTYPTPSGGGAWSPIRYTGFPKYTITTGDIHILSTTGNANEGCEIVLENKNRGLPLLNINPGIHQPYFELTIDGTIETTMQGKFPTPWEQFVGSNATCAAGYYTPSENDWLNLFNAIRSGAGTLPAGYPQAVHTSPLGFLEYCAGGSCTIASSPLQTLLMPGSEDAVIEDTCYIVDSSTKYRAIRGQVISGKPEIRYGQLNSCEGEIVRRCFKNL